MYKTCMLDCHTALGLSCREDGFSDSLLCLIISGAFGVYLLVDFLYQVAE